jgi:hypothetical protein
MRLIFGLSLCTMTVLVVLCTLGRGVGMLTSHTEGEAGCMWSISGNFRSPPLASSTVLIDIKRERRPTIDVSS